jgi:hypothetical protein
LAGDNRACGFAWTSPAQLTVGGIKKKTRQARGFLGGALRCLACSESPSQKKKNIFPKTADAQKKRP